MTEFGSLVFRVAVIAIAVVFGWTYIVRTGERDRADERRALDQRAADLVGRAIAPGPPSPASKRPTPRRSRAPANAPCSRALRRSPRPAPMWRRGSRCSPTRTITPRVAIRATNSLIAGLRRTIAADRYGLASQVLATRDGCTADTCDAFGLVYDDKRLRANLQDRLFDVTVAPLCGELAERVRGRWLRVAAARRPASRGPNASSRRPLRSRRSAS